MRWEDNVPLSEEELRLLEQMERAIVAEDPKFASALRGQSLQRLKQRHVIIAGVAFLGGVALLMTGVITGLWPLGVVGFVVMLLAGTLGLESIRGRTQAQSLFGDSAQRRRSDW
jgi:hypothetical protein